MAKIVTMGEIMLRLSPAGNSRFVQTDSFSIIPGGGEANVAVSCANFGHESIFVSKLPAHEIGQIAVNALRRYGVNTDFIARGGDRIGLYYAETGVLQRLSTTVHTQLLLKQNRKILISTRYSKVLSGSTGQASLQPSLMHQQSACVRLV